jgi:flavin reductase (DIM6/NTAB) family NADH-FMN oxidoreductase RutF
MKKIETHVKPRVQKQPVRKKSWKPGNVLAPVPVVLVSCGGSHGWKPNLITIAWTGSVCSDPPMLSISVRPERYSYEILKSTQEFAVNVPSLRQARVTDWCGMVSGRNIDKFEGARLTPAPALKVKCPIVLECPLNIECRISNAVALGSHTLFLAEVIAVQVTESLLDAKGKLRLEKEGLLTLGQYFALGRVTGRFGYSIRKKKAPSR